MPLDIRIPIGSMFVLMGGLLAGYGLLGSREIYARSLGLNINLIWGSVLLVLGMFLIVMGTRPGRA
jgi:multisubunit Na+/H+ antiporter MnhG subunit